MSPDPSLVDPRAARTRARLRQALLEECAEQPLSAIGVAAVVRRAGVGRATFYVHYADLEALAVDACADVVREAVDALHAWRGIPDPAAPPPALAAFLAALLPYAGLYRSLFTPGGGGPWARCSTANSANAAAPNAPSPAPRNPNSSPPWSPAPSPPSSPTGSTAPSKPHRTTSPPASGAS